MGSASEPLGDIAALEIVWPDTRNTVRLVAITSGGSRTTRPGLTAQPSATSRWDRRRWRFGRSAAHRTQTDKCVMRSFHVTCLPGQRVKERSTEPATGCLVSARSAGISLRETVAQRTTLRCRSFSPRRDGRPTLSMPPDTVASNASSVMLVSVECPRDLPVGGHDDSRQWGLLPPGTLASPSRAGCCPRCSDGPFVGPFVPCPNTS
jgi:hypothetical protein